MAHDSLHLLGIPDLPCRAFQRRCGRLATLEGGKGGGMPPPDPRLVEAQIRSLGVQDQVMQMVLQNAQDLAPLQKEQMQFGIDAAKTAYQQSQQDRDWMLDRRGKLSGLQDQMVTDARTFNTEARREQLAGQAIGDVTQAFASAKEQADRGMTRMGVNPNDGRAVAMQNQLAAGQALGMAAAGNKAREAARQEGYALTDRATNALAGYPSMGMQATGAGAGYGGMGLTVANTGAAGLNSGLTAAGGLAGQMGQNATSMYGQQANLYMQDQAAGDAAWGGLGSALGGIGTAIAL